MVLDVCWAIVVSELIRAVRLIENPARDPNVLYSPQDLIDFVDPVKRSKKREGKDHFCYTSNLTNGFEYVMKNGIQLEDDRIFEGCGENVPDRPSTRLTFIKGYVKLATIQEALEHLVDRPIGAALALFYPEYRNIGEGASKFPLSIVYSYLSTLTNPLSVFVCEKRYTADLQIPSLPFMGCTRFL